MFFVPQICHRKKSESATKNAFCLYALERTDSKTYWEENLQKIRVVFVKRWDFFLSKNFTRISRLLWPTLHLCRGINVPHLKKNYWKYLLIKSIHVIYERLLPYFSIYSLTNINHPQVISENETYEQFLYLVLVALVFRILS